MASALKKILTYPRNLFRTLPDKTAVFVVCTMRSGSTLLKALLATAPDVSHLPEVNFQEFSSFKQIKKLSNKKIIVLKRPAIYKEVETYPIIPNVENRKIIFLTRDVFETVHSLLDMNKKTNNTDTSWTAERLATNYWASVYEGILSKMNGTSDVIQIKYEDLVGEPVKHTERLFSFIGSTKKTGTDTYSKPKKYEWRWYLDDGGEKIKSLKVQANEPVVVSEEFREFVETNDRIQDIRKTLGYA